MPKFGRSFARGRRRSSSEIPNDCELMNDNLLRLLKQDSIDDVLINEELQAVNKEDELLEVSHRWRRRLVHALHSTPIELSIVVLVIIDVIILLTMLVLEIHILELRLSEKVRSASETVSLIQDHWRDNVALTTYKGHDPFTLLKLVLESIHMAPCGNSNFTKLATRLRRAASADGSSIGANPAIGAMEDAEHILHFCSIFILGLMVIETILRIVGQGKAYFKGKLEIVDGGVILISFGMDLYFYRGIFFADGFSNMATVLVIFLLWRMARIFNAIMVTAKRRLEFRIRMQKRARSQLDSKVARLQFEIETHHQHIDSLRALCRRYGASDAAVLSAQPIEESTRRVSTSHALESVLKMSVNFMSGLSTQKAASRLASISNERPKSSLGQPSLLQEDNGKLCCADLECGTGLPLEDNSKLPSIDLEQTIPLLKNVPLLEGTLELCTCDLERTTLLTEERAELHSTDLEQVTPLTEDRAELCNQTLKGRAKLCTTDYERTTLLVEDRADLCNSDLEKTAPLVEDRRELSSPDLQQRILLMEDGAELHSSYLEQMTLPVEDRVERCNTDLEQKTPQMEDELRSTDLGQTNQLMEDTAEPHCTLLEQTAPLGEDTARLRRNDREHIILPAEERDANSNTTSSKLPINKTWTSNGSGSTAMRPPLNRAYSANGIAAVEVQQPKGSVDEVTYLALP